MDYYPENYGAKADGVSNDAAAIQAAIDDCHRTGGRVVLESGRKYYSGSLILKGNVELHLERGAFLQAHKDLATYFHPNEGQKDQGVDIIGTPVTLKPSYAFIYAKDADFMAITGPGVIDGNAFAFVKRVSPYYITGDFYPRPTLIYVEHSNHIIFEDVVLQNAPFWTLHPAGCDDVLISKIHILNSLETANSDGIDPDHSSNVRILGCHITCADDCICLKSSAGNMEYGPTRNVVVSGCTLVSTSAAIKIGTEGTGNFENLTVDNCIISDSNRGISIQIRDGGNVRNAMFSNLIINTRRFADCWWGTAEPITISTHNRVEDKPSGHISHVRFNNIICDSENGVFLSGNNGNYLEDITFEKVSVNISSKSKWPKGLYDLRPGFGKGIEARPSCGVLARRVDGLKLINCSVTFTGEDREHFGEAMCAENCVNVKIEGFSGKAAKEGLEDIKIL